MDFRKIGWAEDRLDDLIQKIETIVSGNKRPAEEVILSENEVLKMLQISKRTLATLRADGIIVYSKVRGILFYRLSSILDMINKNEVNLSLPAHKLFKRTG